MNKSKCLGCEDDFYNDKNDFGIKECNYLKTAKLVMKKKVPLDQVPPWTQKPIKVPSCYKVRGFVFLSPETIH